GALGRVAPIERFNLVSDCFALMQSGALSASEYLDLTARFTAETDRNVWTVLTGSFPYVNPVIASQSRPRPRALVSHRTGAALERLGWEPQPEESEVERQLRGDLLRTLGILGNDGPAQERARDLYARHQAGDVAVDPNVLPALIAIVAWSGGEREYALFE